MACSRSLSLHSLSPLGSSGLCNLKCCRVCSGRPQLCTHLPTHGKCRCWWRWAPPCRWVLQLCPLPYIPVCFHSHVQVLVEMGSSLQMGAAMHRVQDIALESVALHTVRAERGSSALVCGLVCWWRAGYVRATRGDGAVLHGLLYSTQHAALVAPPRTECWACRPQVTCPAPCHSPCIVVQVGAWLLYDTAEGRRRLVCVPLSFKPGEVSAGAPAGLWLVGLVESVFGTCTAALLALAPGQLSSRLRGHG